MDKKLKLTLPRPVDISTCFRYNELTKLGVSNQRAITIAKNNRINIDTVKSQAASMPNDSAKRPKKFTLDNFRIKDASLLLMKTNDSPTSRWINNLVQYQARVSAQRTQTLKDKLTKISDFYDTLNHKYRASERGRTSFFRRVVRINKMRSGHEDADNVYSKDISARVHGIHQKTEQIKLKFKALENYTKYANKFMDFESRINYDKPEEHSVVINLIKNKEFVHDYNDARYRFAVMKPERFFVKRKNAAQGGDKVLVPSK